MAKRIKQITNRAKQAGKAVNQLMATNTGKALAMVPYVPQAISAANTVVSLADDLAELMEGFGVGPVTHPGAPFGQVAGVANNVSVRSSAPKFRNNKGVVRIVHKELVCSVTNNTGINISPTFTASGASVYQVNAGCGTLFPWLSTIAQNFDEYKFNRLRLVYVPICSTADTGRVMIGYDPDSTDAVPVDRQGLSSYSCSAESSVWSVSTLDCNLSNTNKWYYTNISGDNLPSSAYLDQGQVFTACWSGGANLIVGELYALYDVSLKSPQPSAGSVYQGYGTGASVVQAFPSNSPPNLSSTSTTVKVSIPTAGDYLIIMKATSTAIAGTLTFTGVTAALYTFNITDGTHSSGYCVARFSGDTAGSAAFTGLTALGNYEVYVTRAPRFPIYSF